MRLSERLKLARAEKEHKLKDVAKGTGLSIPFISDMERGRTNPSINTLVSLADFYGYRLQEFIQDVDFHL